MAQPQSPGVAPGLSHRAQGLWDQPWNSPIPTGLGAQSAAPPPCPSSGVFQGHLMPGIVPARGPCASSCQRGGGWGMSPWLLLKAGWDGNRGTEIPHHTGPTGMGFPHSRGSYGNGGPIIVPWESQKPLWSHSHKDPKSGDPAVTGIPWEWGSQSEFLFSQRSYNPIGPTVTGFPWDWDPTVRVPVLTGIPNPIGPTGVIIQ